MKKASSKEQACTRQKGNSLSSHNPVDNQTFVQYHVKNYGRQHEQVKKFPDLDRNGLDKLASRMAPHMAQIVKEAASEGVKTASEVSTFQPLVKEALAVLVERKSEVWSTHGKVKVHQGTETSPPLSRMNFGRCNLNSVPDISVVLTENDTGNDASAIDQKETSVIGICEVKMSTEPMQSAIRQQLSESVTKHRSVQKGMDDAWLLPGLVVYTDKAFITMMETGSWWHYTADLKYVQRFDFPPTADSECAFRLLAVLSRYTELLFGDSFTVECAFCDAIELPYFSYPPDIQRLVFPHVVRCRYEVVKDHVIREGSTSLWETEDEVGDNEDIVVKVFTVGLYRHAAAAIPTLKTFLNDAPARQSVKTNKKRMQTILKKMKRLRLDEGGANQVDCFYSIAASHLWIGRTLVLH